MPMLNEEKDGVNRRNKPRHLLGIADEPSILGAVTRGIDTLDVSIMVQWMNCLHFLVEITKTLYSSHISLFYLLLCVSELLSDQIISAWYVALQRRQDSHQVWQV